MWQTTYRQPSCLLCLKNQVSKKSQAVFNKVIEKRREKLRDFLMLKRCSKTLSMKKIGEKLKNSEKY
jgi:hypothetical protein